MTNLDALYLRDLAAKAADNETSARLIRIADNLQRMDEANAILAQNRTYEQGVADAEARMYGRSNVLQDGPSGEQLRGGRIVDSLTSVKVQRIPYGVRALEDGAHQFNAPHPYVPASARATEPKAKSTKAKPAAAKPAITLDLSFLESL